MLTYKWSSELRYQPTLLNKCKQSLFDLYCNAARMSPKSSAPANRIALHITCVALYSPKDASSKNMFAPKENFMEAKMVDKLYSTIQQRYFLMYQGSHTLTSWPRRRDDKFAIESHVCFSGLMQLEIALPNQVCQANVQFSICQRHSDAVSCTS